MWKHTHWLGYFARSFSPNNILNDFCMFWFLKCKIEVLVYWLTNFAFARLLKIVTIVAVLGFSMGVITPRNLLIILFCSEKLDWTKNVRIGFESKMRKLETRSEVVFHPKKLIHLKWWCLEKTTSSNASPTICCQRHLG